MQPKTRQTRLLPLVALVLVLGLVLALARLSPESTATTGAEPNADRIAASASAAMGWYCAQKDGQAGTVSVSLPCERADGSRSPETLQITVSHDRGMLIVTGADL